MKNSKKTLAALALALVAAGSLAACRTADGTTEMAGKSSSAARSVSGSAPAEKSPGSDAPQPSAPDEEPERPRADSELVTISRTALNDLAALPVKGRAPKTGYTRDQFGQSWSDDVSVTYGHNGCDTRNDILKRDLMAVAYKPSSTCIIASGMLRDPYTGVMISFVRGNKTSTKVQIDHVVALSDAWQKGAQQLSADQRRDLANDPRNLMAVDGPTNGSKSDSDAASWLPPNKSYRCTYVAKQITVKKLYGLWVTSAEKAVMTDLLTACAKN